MFAARVRGRWNVWVDVYFSTGDPVKRATIGTFIDDRLSSSTGQSGTTIMWLIWDGKSMRARLISEEEVIPKLFNESL